MPLPEQVFCFDSQPAFLGLFDLSIAPTLLFYSYLPTIILSLLVGFFVLWVDPSKKINRALFFLTVTFSLWVLDILVLWVAAYNNHIMFGWQITPLIEILIFMSAVYLTYSFIYTNEKDIPVRVKYLLFFSVLPVIFLTPTKYNIFSYDTNSCEGVLGPMWSYLYIFELVCVAWIIHLGLKHYRQNHHDNQVKKQTATFITGILSFLFLFISSNLAGEILEYQEISFAGALGMAVFLLFLAYAIAEYKFLNLKVIGANIFILALWITTASLVLIDDIYTIHIAVFFTLIATIILGLLFVHSVKTEVKRREEVQKLAEQLSNTAEKLYTANEKLQELDKQKTEFVSIASHQLRAPLTAIKGYSSMLIEGSFGKLSKEPKETVEKIFESSQRLVNIIEDFLNVTRIELGRMKYEIVEFDLKEVTEKIASELKPAADRKNLKLETEIVSGNYKMKGDSGKLSQVVSNLLDNGLKYTNTGTVTLSLSQPTKDKILLAVKDSGVGIPQAVMPKLFEKFIRSDDAGKTNISGTGLGLYVAKQIVEAHKGRIWAESEGKGKGSTFFVELPTNSQKA